MTIEAFAWGFYLLLSFTTFRCLDPTSLWEPYEPWPNLLARALMGAAWPLLWTLALAFKITRWILND